MVRRTLHDKFTWNRLVHVSREPIVTCIVWKAITLSERLSCQLSPSLLAHLCKTRSQWNLFWRISSLRITVVCCVHPRCWLNVVKRGIELKTRSSSLWGCFPLGHCKAFLLAQISEEYKHTQPTPQCQVDRGSCMDSSRNIREKPGDQQVQSA